jgi:fructan beta-fructosidase
MKTNQYYIDRTSAGKSGFQMDFSHRFIPPRLAVSNSGNITLIVDATSVELSAANGLTTMTSLFFPNKPYNKIYLQASDKSALETLSFFPLKSIW